jgi:hypothetical protein
MSLKNYFVPFLTLNCGLFLAIGAFMIGKPSGFLSLFVHERACGEAISILCGWGYDRLIHSFLL